MSVTVVEDLVDGASASMELYQAKVVRTFFVSGLSEEASHRSYEALTADGIPTIGQSHPRARAFCTQKTVEMVDVDKAKVTVTYGGPGEGGTASALQEGGVFSVSSNTQTIETNLDVDGNTIYSVRQVRTGDEETGDKTGKEDQQGGTVAFQDPITTLRWDRIISRSPAADLSYVGTINDADIWGFKARQILCSRIDARTDDGGLTYHMVYEFQASRRDKKVGEFGPWDASVVFISPNTGRPYRTATENDGYKFWKLYPIADFSGLQLSEP